MNVRLRGIDVCKKSCHKLRKLIMEVKLINYQNEKEQMDTEKTEKDEGTSNTDSDNNDKFSLKNGLRIYSVKYSHKIYLRRSKK